MEKKEFVFAFVTEDKVGVLEQIIHLIVEEGYNIANTVNIPTKDDRVVIEVQIDGVTDLEGTVVNLKPTV